MLHWRAARGVCRPALPPQAVENPALRWREFSSVAILSEPVDFALHSEAARRAGGQSLPIRRLQSVEPGLQTIFPDSLKLIRLSTAAVGAAVFAFKSWWGGRVWLIAAACKAAGATWYPWVRIPPPPQKKKGARKGSLLTLMDCRPLCAVGCNTLDRADFHIGATW